MFSSALEELQPLAEQSWLCLLGKGLVPKCHPLISWHLWALGSGTGGVPEQGWTSPLSPEAPGTGRFYFGCFAEG